VLATIANSPAWDLTLRCRQQIKPGQAVATYLLIIHSVIAAVLLGSITHQTVAACLPARRKSGFVSSFRSVSGKLYTNVNIALYIAMVFFGGLIYPPYRIAVRTYLETARLWSVNGSFELKEQFVTVGLGMLPMYWLVWRQPIDMDMRIARGATTAILCLIVWYSFLVGHIIVNIRGLFGQ
jgi:hypothetical protein